MEFLKDFFDHNKFVRNLNSTFLVLIPKKENAMDIKDYRPISLVGGLYKVLAKVLANRLKRVAGQVVSTAQNAFVEGRQILDAVLITNEAIVYRCFIEKKGERAYLQARYRESI